MDALALAISFTGDGEPWYVPMGVLQLVCLDLCVASRASSTVHVRIARSTPGTILPSAHRTRLLLRQGRVSRVPALRLRAITWATSLARMRRRSMHGAGLVDAAGRLLYRKRAGFNAVVWPTSLTALTFGRHFNQPVDNVIWPDTLKSLTFGWDFDQSIEKVAWPQSLRELTFGYSFNQAVERVDWPASLLQLTFGNWFDRSLDGVVAWPASLRMLELGASFNHPIEGVAWPASLRTLTFGPCFNQAIAGVVWPKHLQQLTFGRDFDRSIEGVSWPASLDRLVFGDTFNQPLCGVEWPIGLTYLRFGVSFDQSMDEIVLPDSVIPHRAVVREAYGVTDIDGATVTPVTDIDGRGGGGGVAWTASLQHVEELAFGFENMDAVHRRGSMARFARTVSFRRLVRGKRTLRQSA